MDSGREITVAGRSEEWMEISPSAEETGGGRTPEEILGIWALMLGARGGDPPRNAAPRGDALPASLGWMAGAAAALVPAAAWLAAFAAR